MKICVLAYPRVASTLLVYTIGHYLRDHHGLNDWQILNECFVPSEKRWLIETDDHLEHVTLPEPVAIPQMREERVALMQKYKHQDYIIKVMAWDTYCPDVMKFLNEAEYEVFAIERRDSFAAILSALVAWKYDFWNQNKDDNNFRPDYQEFDADMEVVDYMTKSIFKYQRVKKQVPIKATLYFEDIIAMTPCEILQSLGFGAKGVDESHVTKKLLGTDNAALIRNIDDVRARYDASVAAHLNTQS